MTDSPLLDVHRESVQEAWVDYNGHMNVAYYVLVFDHATDTLLDHIGLDESYRVAHEGSVFVVEAHVTYESEVMAGDRLAVTTRILDVDPKRMHVFHRMTREGAPHETVATNELMILHMDMNNRRAAPMPDDILARLEDMQRNQNVLDSPPQAGRVIGIRRKPATVGS